MSMSRYLNAISTGALAAMFALQTLESHQYHAPAAVWFIVSFIAAFTHPPLPKPSPTCP